MNDILMEVLNCVITISVIVVMRYLIPYFNLKIKGTKYEKLVDYVREVVNAMQQTLDDNDEKKKQAIQLMLKYMNKYGLVISNEELDILIESAVKQLKIEEKNQKTIDK